MHNPCHCAMPMGTVLFSALIIVLMNLIIDISYGFVDPRVCYQVGMPFSKRGTFAARARQDGCMTHLSVIEWWMP